jgi:glycosyltransferase involved in cell wall biosynthesis
VRNVALGPPHPLRAKLLEGHILISIIVRTKNEERWIGSCLDAIARQTCADYEVVLVDNNSTDRTLAKALQHDVKVVAIDAFKPGAAINRGIEAASGDVIVCLSGHCIPVDENWLANLVAGLDDDTVGGVYGRQEPLAFTPDLDKRDLLITFGLDPRVQIKDSFFHNANSAFRYETWRRFPFDEEVTNIEDRIWASQVQAAGMKILYEPSASVYHHHGIHHNGDAARCGNIIRILDSVGQEEIRTADNKIDARTLRTVLVIPVREEGLRRLAGRPLYQYSIEHAKSSQLVRTVAVSTDDEGVAQEALAAGADLVLTRTQEESRFDVILELMMQSSLQKLEERGILPDIIVMLEATFPFRHRTLIDKLIYRYVEGGFDTVIPARSEYNSCWMEEDGAYHRVDDGYVARQFKRPFYTGLKGLCCVCSPATIRQGQLFGDNVGLFKLTDAVPGIEVRSDEDVALAETIMASPLFAARLG